MLYQLRPRTGTTYLLRRVAGLLAGLAACLVRAQADRAYLDGMRDGELEDLGLRRANDGRYRDFS